MSKTLDYLKNPYVRIDGHDFSTYVKSVAITMQKDELDTTASGDNAHSQIPGLSKDSLEFTFYQDRDLDILDRVLFNIYNAGAAVVIEVAKSGSVISAANPSYEANARLYSHSPWAGDVGQVVMAPARFLCDGPITRANT